MLDCGFPRNSTITPPVNGEEGKFCVANGDAAIKFLGFDEVSKLMHLVFGVQLSVRLFTTACMSYLLSIQCRTINQLSQGGRDCKTDMNKLLVPHEFKFSLFRVPENLPERFRQLFSVACFYPLFLSHAWLLYEDIVKKLKKNIHCTVSHK